MLIVFPEIPAGFGPGSTAPSNTHVLIGGIAELACQPTGSPKPTVRWRNVDKNQEVISQGRFSILKNGNLRIQRVLATDKGKYKCIVWNVHGSTSRSAELFVRGKYTKRLTLTIRLSAPGAYLIFRLQEEQLFEILCINLGLDR